VKRIHALAAAALAAAVALPGVAVAGGGELPQRRSETGLYALGNMFRFIDDFAHDHCASRNVACARELNPRRATFAGWLAANRDALRRAAGGTVQAA
jgi:hypothetical protein